MKLYSLRNLGILVLLIAVAACENPASISGKLKGVKNEDTKVYLIQPRDLNEVAASFLGKLIDSAAVAPNGSFKFEDLPNTKEPVLLELAVKQQGKAPNYLENDELLQSNYMPLVWNSKESIDITANVKDFQRSFSIEKPSAANEALMQLRDIRMKAYQEHLAGKHWQVENGSELLKKEKAILDYQNELIRFANQSDQLLPALVALRWVSVENNYERVPEFLVDQCNKWKEIQPGHAWVKQLCEKSAPANLPVLIGDDFPELQLPTLQKDTISLKDELGAKLTIIDLWASWCAPCRKENREILVPLWQEYHEQGLQIIAYGLETSETAWRKAAERDGADQWLQTSDLQGDDAAFLKNIRIHTIPANFILDEKGVVIAKNVHGEALKQLVTDKIKRK